MENLKSKSSLNTKEKDFSINNAEKENKFLLNAVNEGCGLQLLKSLESETVQLVIFDPQYENVKDATTQHKEMGDHSAFYAYPIKEQTEQQIKDFCQEIKRILKPSGYLSL
jgi:site-specific DNA-methyltransferase (adenine-specific)